MGGIADMSRSLNLSDTQAREAYAARAVKNKKYLERLISLHSEGSRSKRQQAAATVYLAAQAKPERLIEQSDAIFDALMRPEAQTRWECLRALACLVPAGLKLRKNEIALVEDALFDEDSGNVREAAFLLLCTYGATTKSASKKVWSLLDEAIQCYHGNPEFAAMLSSLIEFAKGKIDPEIKDALKERMAFDAENGVGTHGMRSKQIVDACK